MRLSALQRETLDLLFQVYQKIGNRHFPCMKLFEILNAGRAKEASQSNFRVSCHTLERHGLIELVRIEPSAKLSARLTPNGIEKAEFIHQQRKKEAE